MQARVIEESAVIDRRSGWDRRSGQDRRGTERPGAPRRTVIRRVADRVPLEIQRALEDWYKEFRLPEEVFQRLMSRLAASLASAFGVERDEVAILLLKDQGQLLRFAFPLVLYVGKTNLFPVKTNSIAGQVVLARKGRIDNDVSTVRHLYIYERVRGKDRRPFDIQKMVTAPLLLPGGEAVGVIQVSRRARSPRASRADFIPFDLLKLRDLGRGLAPYIHRVMPADF